jgi:hypothetical protein
VRLGEPRKDRRRLRGRRRRRREPLRRRTRDGRHERSRRFATSAIETPGTNGVFDEVVAAISASPAFATVFGSAASTFFSGNDCVTLPQIKAQLDAALPPLTLTFGLGTSVSAQATATEYRASQRVGFAPHTASP